MLRIGVVSHASLHALYRAQIARLERLLTQHGDGLNFEGRRLLVHVLAARRRDLLLLEAAS